MCGIVGWINLQGNISDNREIIEQMSETLHYRGPDEYGYYVSKNALLSNRRLVVVDPKGGAQPMTRNHRDNLYTIVYNGELYNTEDIRKMLLAKGYKFNSYSDTEVLLVSYIEWGPDCVKHLNGIYGFVIWDENKKELFMARDRLGVKPLFYSQRGDDFFFGSEIKAILAHPEVNPIIDETGLLEIFGLGPARSPGSGMFKGINEVRPGYCLLYKREGLKVWQYWFLESKEHEDDFETTIEKVRGLLIDTIERQLISDVPVCSFLSGGTDSSAISSIASKVFEREGKGKLKTFSIDYLDNEKYFTPTVFQPNSDPYWVTRMSNYLKTDHYNIVIDTPELSEYLRESVYANDYPGMADIDSSLYLFCREVKKHATVALTGECADEIFGGYPWYRREEDINASTFPWSKFVSDRRKVLSNELLNLPLEEYVEYNYKKTLSEVPKLDGESNYQSRMRELFYLNFQWFMITLLNRKDRMSMANSLEVRVPFANHRIVEYTWNIPPEFKFCDNMEKGFLRRALKGILPYDVLRRKKSPYPKTHNPSYTKAVQKWLKEIMGNKNAPLHQLINKRAVNDIIETAGASYTVPWFGQLMRGPQLMAYLIQLNIWLEDYKIILQI